MDITEEQMDMIADCLHRESKMTEWEVEFMHGINAQVNDAQPLSIRQIEKLDSVWEKVTANG